MKHLVPFLVALSFSFVPEAGFAACPATLEAGGHFHYVTRVNFSSSLPLKIQNGITSGLGQWNDCNPSGYDWPWFDPGSTQAEDAIHVNYTPGQAPVPACASFNRANGEMCLWDSYVAASGVTVDCTHSEAAVSDIIAHEVGHYLGLGEADPNNRDCDTSIMGVTRVDSSGRIKSDYSVSTEEKDVADDNNSNEQEEFEEECGQNREECGGQADGTGSPILINLDGGGFRLTGLDDGVEFDIDGEFILEEMAWTVDGSGEGFLFRNRFGGVGPDSGRELFGNFTPSPLTGNTFANGYEALAEMDSAALSGNENGLIDPNDAFFHSLGVWIDRDHDGRYRDEELFSLEELGILSLSVQYRESTARDRHGNEFRFRSFAWIEGKQGYPRRISTSDVFLLVGDETVEKQPRNRPTEP